VERAAPPITAPGTQPASQDDQPAAQPVAPASPAATSPTQPVAPFATAGTGLGAAVAPTETPVADPPRRVVSSDARDDAEVGLVPSDASVAASGDAGSAATPFSTAPAAVLPGAFSPTAAKPRTRPGATTTRTIHRPTCASILRRSYPRRTERDGATELGQRAAIGSASTAPAEPEGRQAGGAGGSAPGAPSPPPCSGSGSSGGSAGGAFPGAWAAVLAGSAECKPAAEPARNRLSPALWRPIAFVSLQERPG
jgi:hypothetical protein